MISAFEEVWVVFDVEHASNGRGPAIAPAVQAAIGKKLKLAISNPSFEVWYLLHDRVNPPGVMTSAACIPHLRACAGA